MKKSSGHSVVQRVSEGRDVEHYNKVDGLEGVSGRKKKVRVAMR